MLSTTASSTARWTCWRPKCRKKLALDYLTLLSLLQNSIVRGVQSSPELWSTCPIVALTDGIEYPLPQTSSNDIYNKGICAWHKKSNGLLKVQNQHSKIHAGQTRITRLTYLAAVPCSIPIQITLMQSLIKPMIAFCWCLYAKGGIIGRQKIWYNENNK